MFKKVLLTSACLGTYLTKPERKSVDYYLQGAVDYAKSVAARPQLHCRFMQQTASNFVTQVNQGIPGFYLCDKSAYKICYFMEQLPHIKGSQFTGCIELEPWQVFHFVNVFGWLKPGPVGLDGVLGESTRKHTTAFAMMSKKQGKSTQAAGVGLYMISPLENEKGAEVYCAASKRDQAKIVLNVARQMLAKSPILCRELRFAGFAHHIECEIDGVINKMSTVASDAPTTDDGINPSCNILDELHAMTDLELRETLFEGLAARVNPLSYEITTAGESRDESPAMMQYAFAQDVIRGDKEASWYFPMIFEQDDVKTEISMPETWVKSNPNLGVSVTLDRLKLFHENSVKSPISRTMFIQKHLNAFTGASSVWLEPLMWDASYVPRSAVPEDLPLYIGFDLSQLIDLTAIGLVWVREGVTASDAEYWVAGESFTTEVGASRNRKIKQYVDAGLIEVAGSDSIDQQAVESRILELNKTEYVVEVGFDPWNAAHLSERLAESGGMELVEVRQGARTFSEPMKNFEAALLGGRVHVVGDPCLTWQAGNLEVHADPNENWRPVKTGNRNKVDTMVAILIGFVRAWRHVEGVITIVADDVVSKV